jgi:pyruvate formate-lyase/glycerol dehydratase family glycyl radical enzyme
MAIHPANQRTKDRILSAPYEICIERARFYTDSYRRTEGEHPALRAARAFACTLGSMTVTLQEDELIAGNRSSKLLGVVIPVERGDVNTILEMDLEFLTSRKEQPFHIDSRDREELFSTILPYWRGRTVRDRKKSLYRKNGLNFFPAVNPLSLYRRARSLDLERLRRISSVPKARPGYVVRGLRELLHNNPALVMNVFDVQGHLILGHRNILEQGFSGVRKKAGERLARALRDGDREGEAFLRSVIISCDAVREFAERVSRAAEADAAREADTRRKQELLEMAARCRHVPFHPPRNFHEAVQALWLTQVCATVAHGMVGIFAVGRFDQYLYPFYARDRERGAVTPETAVRLLEELLIKLGSNLMVLPYAAKRTANELGSDSCAPTVGGVDARGENAVNELSHLILDAFGNVKSLGNSFTIRLSEKSTRAFWKKAMAVYRRTSGAALFCDETVVRALESCGMSRPDARDYGVIGCVEPTGDGNTFGCTSGNDISFAAAVEMAMLNGRLRIMGRRVGPKTGDPRRFETFEQFMDAFRGQVAFMVRTVARAVNLKDRIYRDHFPCPLVSATLSGCVENARDMTSGGADYSFGSIGGRGFGTAVDSLAAVRHFVFEKKAFTMRELLRMLDTNFRGAEKERRMLLNRAPKYGMDHDGADEIARDVAAFFCREVSRERTILDGPFRPGFFSYGMHVLEGAYLGASPSGRLAGEPVSNSFSPSNGSERNGPTAMLRSIAKIDHSRISNGCAVNIKLLPGLFETNEGLDRMIGLVEGYFASGGMELQPNVVSNEVLLDAQKHPENYRDLVVRVSGYSAIFLDLGRPLQDEIISRCEFSGL